MALLGYEQFGPQIPRFAEFWAFLTDLAGRNGCAGCRGDDGNPNCGIRVCAREKGVDFCAVCGAYPCAESERSFAAYPMLKDDNRILRTRGIAAWKALQDDRQERGIRIRTPRTGCGERSVLDCC